jgi:glycine betaine/proline transport system permease protein
VQSFFLHLTFADLVNDKVTSFVQAYGDAFHQFSAVVLRYLLVPLEGALRALPPWLVLIVVGVLAWHATRRVGVAGFFVLLLYAIGCLGLWEKLMQTLALMMVAAVISVVLGVPIGIFTSRSAWLRRILLPVLDIMQTLPSFVYLIPVLMLFGLGKVPAIFATVIYALPPLIRLTDLGIRHVDADVVEAARAFGTTRWQLLVNVQMPLARPSIMAGINQTTMMALSMVVIASMIGARGLGEDVLAGIQTLDIGRGLQAGIAIVILAIVIDRISQGYGQDRRTRRQAKAVSRVPYHNAAAGANVEAASSAADNPDAADTADNPEGLTTRTAK